MKHRIHLLVTSWLPVSEHYQSCAFTQKAIKFSKMMLSLGHEVYIYGVKSRDFETPPCTEFIETHTLEDIRASYGDGNKDFEIGYNWMKEIGFKLDNNGEWSQASEAYFNGIRRELPKRMKENDIVCATFGAYYGTLLNELKIELFAEYGIGYPNVIAQYRAYESSYIQNYTYGKFKEESFRAFDRVIPNYFDPEVLPFADRKEKQDYLLYLGRLIPRKGIFVAARMAAATHTKLLLAGQGDIEISGPWIEYVGWADPKKRAYLMGHAKAVLMPTIYLEPFGGVAVEAQICGTPVITANTGAFPETVIQGVTGFRCDTFQDYVDAVSKVDALDPKVIRKHSERYFMDNVKWEYQKWFDELIEGYSRVKSGIKDPFFYLEKGVKLNSDGQKKAQA